MSARTDERRAFKEMLADSSRLEAAYQDWLKARAELERWDRLAEDFREHERRRQPYLDEINAQKAMLEQERSGLLVRKVEAGEQASELQRLDQHISATGDRLQETEAKLRRRDEIVARLDGSRQEFAALRAENESLRKQMDEIQERIGRIQKIESPDCPLCGQPLSPAHRATTMAELQTQGTGFGDLWRDNKSRMDNMATEALPLENELSDLRGIDDARAAQTGLLSELRARREAASSITTEWKQSGAKRLA
jgi:DNA repair exonuclease SbcCD ATPase subunit